MGRSRKRRALLAGGAVLGIGSTATLAAWTDDVWVLSSFTTSPFNVEASVDGDDWKEFEDSPGGGLVFEPSPPDGLSAAPLLPGDSIYAPLNLRIERGETSGQVSLAAVPAPPSENGEFFNSLRLSLFAVEPGACNAAGTDSADVIDGFEIASMSHGAGFDLATLPAPGGASVGEAVGICFKITLPASVGPEVAGGTAGNLVWNLKAEPIE